MTKEEALNKLMVTWANMPAGQERIDFKDHIICFSDHTPETNYSEAYAFLSKYPDLKEATDVLKLYYK